MALPVPAAFQLVDPNNKWLISIYKLFFKSSLSGGLTSDTDAFSTNRLNPICPRSCIFLFAQSTAQLFGKALPMAFSVRYIDTVRVRGLLPASGLPLPACNSSRFLLWPFQNRSSSSIAECKRRFLFRLHLRCETFSISPGSIVPFCYGLVRGLHTQSTGVKSMVCFIASTF